jgi:hypothetical protein
VTPILTKPENLGHAGATEGGLVSPHNPDGGRERPRPLSAFPTETSGFTMSSGHHQRFHFGSGPDIHDKRWKRFDAIVTEAIHDKRVKDWLARPFEVVTRLDMPYLGGSSIGGERVYLDRHLCAPGKTVGVILVEGVAMNVRPPLIRHERFEQCLEDVFGLPYLANDPDDPSAHVLATIYEHRIVKNPPAYESALRPFIKHDQHEKLVSVPGDYDIRPVLNPPIDGKLLDRLQTAMNNSKLPQDDPSIKYEDVSSYQSQKCGICGMFVRPLYGGPACTIVRDEISPRGRCRKFERGVLGEMRKAA